MSAKRVKEPHHLSAQVSGLSTGVYSRDEHVRDGNQNENDGDTFTGQALSNYLVLKVILSNLENGDIESCCQVNELWNSVADPLLIRYYDIKLNYGLNRESHPVTLKKRATYSSPQPAGDCDYNLDEACELLDTAIQTEKIAINLDVVWYEDNESVIMSFLAKFGKLVEAFNVRHDFTARAFWKLLVDNLPKLKFLSLFETSLNSDDEYFDENLENEMKHLRKISDLSNETIGRIELASIFRLAPNLEEIWDFPIMLADTLIQFQKASCVKSLAYPTMATADASHDGLEKLSHLELKLESFSFHDLHAIPAVVYPSIQRILESSHDSLESLTLYETKPFDFQAIPPLISLKKLTLFFNDHNPETCGNKLFAPDIDLKRLFPNVSVVKIPTFMYHVPVEATSTRFWNNRTSWRMIEDITALFTANQFLPWGSRIEKLKLTDVSVNILEQLSRPFSSVTNLKFHMGGNSNDFQLLFPAIGHCWPDLESLTVVITYSTVCCSHNEGDQEWTLDSVFTGIPDNVLAKLREPESRKACFSEEDVLKFMEAATIRTFKKLQVLKFDFEEGMLDCKFMKKLSAITSVSKEFGFQFLPQLKVAVRIRESESQLVSDMKTSLQTIVNFEVESVD